MTKRNIIIWSVFGIAVLLLILFVYFFYIAKDNTGEGVHNASLGQNEPILTDEDIYGEAVDKKDIALCERIQDLDMRGICVDTLTNMTYYNQALSQFNPDVCERITETEMKEACMMVVDSGISYLEEEDPVYLADTYAFSHNEKAIDEYEKIIDSNPDDFHVLLSLALAYAEKGLNEQGRGGSQDFFVNKALETIERAKKVSLNDSELFRVEAYINEIIPNLPSAIDLYNKSIELDPKNALAYAGRGHVYDMMGFLNNALNDFNEAAKNDPDKKISAIYSNLCRLAYSSSELIDVALENCNFLINMENASHVDVAQAHQILASILVDKKEYIQAEKNLASAKILNPNDSNLYVTFANYYLETNQPEQALLEAEYAISLTPNKSTAYYFLSKAYYMLGEFDESNEASLEGLDRLYIDESLLAPYKSSLGRDLYYMLANSYDKKGDDEKALEYKKMGDDLFLLE